MSDTLVDDCCREALALLRSNTIAAGIMAATRTPAAENRRYTRVFARDAGICALAMIRTDDPLLRAAAHASLLTLARHQADNGQIPKYVDPEREDSDFWYVGCVDATLWWLIAVHHVDTYAPELKVCETLQPQIERALTWLACQEHPRLFLLRQDEASDWADIMPRSGFVLYTNALWYYVKTLYGVEHRAETHYHFNHLFYPFTEHTPAYRRLRLLRHYVRNRSANRNLYLSFVNFSFWGDEGDVFGNLLALLLGLADQERTGEIMHALDAAQVAEPWPVRATCEPIGRASPLWRTYMERHQQNLEFQYHNGGCWPFIGGFWVMALTRFGQRERAQQALSRLAQANAVGDWAFREWFHGRTGEPHGMTGQSWNAAMFLLAHRAVERSATEPPGAQATVGLG
ncbi:MAG: glycoside hydrolase 100 family protein [Gammaproteobacteria bacterium]